MKRTSILQLIMISAITITMLLSFTAASSAVAATTVLRVAYYSPDNHPLSMAAKEVFTELEKLTQGRVKFKLFASSSLIPTTEMAAGVNDGTAFCANWYLPYLSKTIPLFDIETIPLWTAGHYKGITDAYENGLNDLYTEALNRQGFENLKVAGVSMCLWRVLTTKQGPVRVPADAKGMKIRSVGSEADMWKLIGASPVNITTPQTYEALSRGIADGATNYLETMKDRKWLENTKHVTTLNLTPVLMHIIYNTKMLNQLDPQDKVIVEFGMKYLADQTRLRILDGEADAFIQIPKEFGTKIYIPNKEEHQEWLKAAAPTVAEYEKSKDPLVQKALKIVRKYNP